MSSGSIGFIGAGQMAQALARGFVDAGHAQGEDLFVTDVVEATAQRFCQLIPGATSCSTTGALVKSTDLIFLAVKPQNVADVAQSLTDGIGSDKLLVSICAGVTLDALARFFKRSERFALCPTRPV